MTKKYVSLGGLIAVGAILAGCTCPECDSLHCGDGTMEQMIGPNRTCVVAPLECGAGSIEETTGSERKCVPDSNVTSCGVGTYPQEQTIGGDRECQLLPSAADCDDGQIEFLSGAVPSCRDVDSVCADGTYEQTVGGERECVFDPSMCGSGTHEQTIGGDRECQPDAS